MMPQANSRGEMAESNTKPVCRQLLTKVRPESDSSSEEEETPQFHKGIVKQIEKVEQMLKKCEERGEVVEKKDSKRISGDGEEEEFDYEKWVNGQCRKIGPQCVLGILCLVLFLSDRMLFSNVSIWELNCYK